MRFLFIGQGYPGVEGASSGSGVGTYLYEMCQGLIARNHSCDVIVWQKGKGPFPLRQNVGGVTLHLLQHSYWSIIERWAPDSRDVYNLRQMVRQLDTESPFDWIEIQSEEGIAIGCQQDFPDKVLISVHTTLAQMIRFKRIQIGHRERYRLNRERRSIATARWVLIRFPISRTSIKKRACGDRESNSGTAGVGQVAEPEAKTRRTNSAKPTILIIGTADLRKGFDRIRPVLEAYAQQYGSACFRVITNDIEKTRRLLEADRPLPSGMELRVESGLTSDEMDQAYRTADVVFHPARYESFGLTCIEPARYGTPLVATNVGIVSNLMTGELARYIVNSEQPTACAEALKQVMDDRDRLGHLLRERYQAEFTRDQMVTNHLDLIRSLDDHKQYTKWGARIRSDADESDRAQVYQCCYCEQRLSSESHGQMVKCPNCGREYPMEQGLINFSHDRQFYWGELERTTMQKLLQSPKPLAQAVDDLLLYATQPVVDYLRHYALDQRRAAWSYLLHIPPQGRALDFGCGWGALALSLGELFDEMWVTDVVPERVAVTLRRAREAGKQNFQGCIASGWPKLPFRDGFFDVVILNGVLEWIPSSIHGDPEKIQSQFLREIRRVIKPSGQLYIGIENRFGFGYFLGKEEEHTKFKYISLLPRSVAQQYYRIGKGGRYSQYTYGRRGLSKLLKTAGFPHQRFYCPYPDYREFTKLFDLDNPMQLKESFSPVSRFGKVGFALARTTGLLKYLAPSFGAVASSGEFPSFVQELLATYPTGTDTPVAPSSVIIKSYLVSPAGNVLIRLTDSSSGTDTLLTLPVDSRAGRRVANETIQRKMILARGASGIIKQSLELKYSGEFRGVPFQIEEFSSGSKLSKQKRITTEQTHEIWALLAELNSGMPQNAEFSAPRYFGAEVVEAFCAAVGMGSGDFKERFVRIWNARTGIVHGDFHSGNLLVNKDGDLVRIIDWDLATLDGLPFWDLLTFYCHRHFERGLIWAQAYEKAIEEINSEQLASYRKEYVEKVGLTSDDFAVAAWTFPLFQWQHKMKYGDGHGEVITHGLLEVLAQESHGPGA